jgi:hypothetical protein
MERRALDQVYLDIAVENETLEDVWLYLTAIAFDAMTNLTRDNAMRFSVNLEQKSFGKMLPKGVHGPYVSGDPEAWGVIQRDSKGNAYMPNPVRDHLRLRAEIVFWKELKK